VIVRHLVRLDADQVRRKTAVHVRVDHEGHLAVRHVRGGGQGRLERIHGQRDMPAVEVPAHEHDTCFRVDERVVIGAVRLYFDPPGHPPDRVVEHAEYLRRAAERIGVLEGFQSRCLELRGIGFRLQQPGNNPRDAVLPGMGFCPCDCGVVVVRVAHEGMYRQCRGGNQCVHDLARPVDSESRDAGHDRCPVHHGERLFRRKHVGRETLALQRLGRGNAGAAVKHLALAHERGCHV